jgi:hypothetical protein
MAAEAEGESAASTIVEHVAGVEDYQVALATFRAACERWPGIEGARVIDYSRRTRTASWSNRVVAKAGAKRHAFAG